MKRIVGILLFFIIASACWAEGDSVLGDSLSIDSVEVDSVQTISSDSAKISYRESLRRTKWWKVPFKIVGDIYDYLFVDADEDYIERDMYHMQALIRNDNTYEIYRLADDEGNSIRFSPEMSAKIGPYVGYSFFFYGLSVDVTHLTDVNRRSESTFSIYSLPIGIDLYYRKSGDNFRIREVNLADVDTSPLENKKFDGISSTIAGFNTYYIFNHNHFSYPAAFSQSTVQRKSAGSALAGIGYTHHTLKVDWMKLKEVATESLGMDVSGELDRDVLLEKVVYTDFSLSGGYGYNWVFHQNWLFASSLSLALAYKHSSGKFDMGSFMLKDFSFNNFNVDGVGRFAIVYNNSKWFAGASVVAHTYNYKKSRFYTNNSFGSLKIYVGFNFWKKKHYKQ